MLPLRNTEAEDQSTLLVARVVTKEGSNTKVNNHLSGRRLFHSFQRSVRLSPSIISSSTKRNYQANDSISYHIHFLRITQLQTWQHLTDQRRQHTKSTRM